MTIDFLMMAKRTKMIITKENAQKMKYKYNRTMKKKNGFIRQVQLKFLGKLSLQQPTHFLTLGQSYEYDIFGKHKTERAKNTPKN